MTQSLDVDGKRFLFPTDWQALKYDDSAFHRHQFQNFAGGSKAMDLVALSPGQELWLIEVKDYTRHRRSKSGSLFDEVAAKVRATLARLAVARVRAYDPHERQMADKAMRARSIRMVLHLDQPRHPSRLFPQAIDPRSATQKLQQSVRGVDPQAFCHGSGSAQRAVPWSVG